MYEIKAFCAVATELPAEGPPEWVKLMSVGAVSARDGRRWTLKDAAAVVATSLARASGVDLVIDYEHQTDNAETNGQAAPAAGWVKELQARPDGVWARVEWTGKAREYLQGREYRYLSPTFTHTKDGTVTSILRAALTNDPALSDLPALAKKEDEVAMDELLKKLLAAIGLDEKADEKTALARVEALKADAEKAAAPTDDVKAMAKAAGLDEGADLATVSKAVIDKLTAAPAEDQPDPTQFVSKASFDEVSAQLKRIQDERTEEKAMAAVEAGMRSGKVTPGQKDWAVAYAKKDPDGFKSYLDGAPVVAAPSGGVPTGQPPKAAGGDLTAEDKALCRQLGLSEDEFKKARDEEVS